MIRWIANRVVVVAAIGAVLVYQGMIRPMLLGSCKFHPSCSAYAIEALSRFGLIRGGALALRRLARCHPWAIGGLDPLPHPQTSS